MSQPLYIVDAFARGPFTGNPAGVCPLPGPADDHWMQQVAMEMNQAETAFIHRKESGFSLRWFTPVAEVDLCGHATLASAHTLWEIGWLKPDESIVFHTRSGELTCSKEAGLIAMDFPASPPRAADPPRGLEEALGARITWCGENGVDVMAELENEDSVKHLSPDIARLAALEVRGVLVTARGSGDFAFVSRFFAPSLGIPEDPATGSTHCCLGPYWAEKLGKTDLRGFQASKRGGFISVRVNGSRVILKGHAQTVLRGELCPSSS